MVVLIYVVHMGPLVFHFFGHIFQLESGFDLRQKSRSAITIYVILGQRTGLSSREIYSRNFPAHRDPKSPPMVFDRPTANLGRMFEFQNLRFVLCFFQNLLLLIVVVLFYFYCNKLLSNDVGSPETSICESLYKF